ncbi:arylesterase [Endozoicomonas sp. OPT23]|uniref:arylesterase n=1 Tax=Endozoicomonas sp. OPT23 TaxID=2072845 RepID=UPI00351AB791
MPLVISRYLFSALVLSCVFLVSAPYASAAQQKTLLVYGDSLSAAYGIDIKKGWVTLLQEKMKQTNPGWKVVNASVSGETTSGGLSRLKVTLEQHTPDLVLVELGANDGLRGTSLKILKNNLGKIIETVQSKDTPMALFEMRIPPNYGPIYTKRFTQTFHDLGKNYNIPVVPFFLDGVAGHPELNQPDGIHPVEKAQPKLLDNVWPDIQKILKNT